MQVNIYNPRTSGEKFPVVIGMPGLVHSEEVTRADVALHDLARDYKIAGIRITYKGINQDLQKKKIECKFNLDEAARDLEEAINFAKEDPRYDSENIGILVSSLSAGFFAHYLHMNRGKDLKIRKVASISPLYSWNNFGTPEQRAHIERCTKDFPISSQFDKEKGVKRYIPRNQMHELIKMDGLEDLRSLKGSIPKLEVLTMIGSKDDRASPEAMEEGHYLLGGETKGIIKLENGHDIPLMECIPRLVRFFSSMDGNPPKLLSNAA